MVKTWNYDESLLIGIIIKLGVNHHFLSLGIDDVKNHNLKLIDKIYRHGKNASYLH